MRGSFWRIFSIMAIERDKTCTMMNLSYFTVLIIFVIGGTGYDYTHAVMHHAIFVHIYITRNNRNKKGMLESLDAIEK